MQPRMALQIYCGGDCLADLLHDPYPLVALPKSLKSAIKMKVATSTGIEPVLQQ